MRQTFALLLFMLASPYVNAHVPSPRTAEDHVYFVVAMQENCSATQPSLNAALVAALHGMKSRNSQYFEDVEKNPNYAEIISILRQELDEISSTQKDCEKLLNAIQSPQSDLSRLPK